MTPQAASDSGALALAALSRRTIGPRSAAVSALRCRPEMKEELWTTWN
jgi:hypothetical protein